MAQFLRPSSTISVQRWERAKIGSINDVVPHDAKRSWTIPGRPEAKWQFKLSAPGDTPAGGLSTIRYRIARTSWFLALIPDMAQIPRYQLRLYQGETLIAQSAERTADIPAANPLNWWDSLFAFLRPRFETYTWTFDTSGVTDWSDVRAELEVVGFDNPYGFGASVALSWLEMEVPDDVEVPLDENIITGAPLVAEGVLLVGAARTENRLLLSGDQQGTGSDALMLSGDEQGGDDYLLLAPDLPATLTGNKISVFPVLGQPPLWLVPDGITTGVPTLGQPAVFDGTLTPNKITTGAPLLEHPALAVRHNLTGNEITTTPVVAEGVLSVLYVLLGDEIVTGAPLVAEGTARVMVPLVGDAILGGAPELAFGTLRENHQLSGVGIETTPLVGAGELHEKNRFSGDEITTGAPELSRPIAREAQALHGDDLLGFEPLVGIGIFDQNHRFSGDEITTGAPTVAPADFSQTHTFLGHGISTGIPTVGKAALAQLQVFLGDDIATGAPELGDGALVFRWKLFGDEITTGAPTLGHGGLEQWHFLLGDMVRGRHPRLDRGFVEPPPGAPREIVVPGFDREVVIGSEDREVAVVGYSREIVAGRECRIVAVPA